MSVRAGNTVFLRESRHSEHLYVVVTDPSADDPPSVVIANITTQREWSDTTTCLDAGEHPFVKHASVVNYGDARIVEAANIRKAMELFETHRDCSPELLKRIQEGILKSPRTPHKVKEYCREQLL